MSFRLSRSRTLLRIWGRQSRSSPPTLKQEIRSPSSLVSSSSDQVLSLLDMIGTAELLGADGDLKAAAGVVAAISLCLRLVPASLLSSLTLRSASCRCRSTSFCVSRSRRIFSPER